MRRFLAIITGALLALTAVAMLLRPSPPPPGVTPLVWASGANPFRLAQIERFNELHPTLRLQLDSSNNRFEKIIVQNSSGVGPDVFDVLTGSYLQAYVESGVAWDLTKHSEGISAQADTWPAIHEEITYNDRQYGYPANVGTFLILYNKNVFDRFGVPYPDPAAFMTWDEFTELLLRVSGIPPGGGHRIWGTNAVDYSGRTPTPYFWKTIFYSRHGEFFSEDRTRPTVDTEDMLIAFRRHQEALFRTRILPTTIELGSMTGQGGWGNGGITQFAEGRFATIVSGKFALAAVRGFVEDQKRKLARWEADPERQSREPRPEVLRLGVFPLPRFADRPISCVAVSQTVVINPASKHRDGALVFLRFLASERYARMVEIYGIPGNPRNVRYDYPISHPELAEHEITRCAVDSLQYGYQTRKSPFLLNFDVDRVLNEQAMRLEADPAADIELLLREAQQQLEALLQLNLSRDSDLAARYRATLKGSRPAVATTP